MKKHSSLFIIRVLILSFIVFSIDAAVKKPWTFLVYLAAANDLNSYSDLDIDEMMKIGSGPNVNVIVYLTQGYNEPKSTKRLYINKNSITQIGSTTAEDSGSVETLKRALAWANNDYPSDNICVVMWNHGSGPLNRARKDACQRGVCYDFDTNHFLTDGDCRSAFSWGMNSLRGGKKYDIIAYDACLMAGIETAYTLADCANYLVASQETIPGDGYQYSYVLDDLVSGVPTPRDFARSMVLAYDQEYNDPVDFTLSAIDLSQIKPLVLDMNKLSKMLTTALGNKKVAKTVKNYIKKSKTLVFDEGTFADLYNLLFNLGTYASNLGFSTTDTNTFKVLVTSCCTKIQSMVFAKVSSKNYKKAGGLSVYLPTYVVEVSYADLYWSTYSNWLGFLRAYVG